MKHPLLSLVAAGVMAVSAIGCSREPPPPPPLQGADIGGDFTLLGSDGQDVSWDDFEGQYRLVYFGYTFCPDVCPVDVQRMARGYAAFKDAKPDLAANLVPIFITVDPERDTPAKVGEFAAAFSPDLVGLTGSPEAIAATAKKFAAYSKRGEATPDGGYLVDHSRTGLLFGPAGEPLATISVDASAQAVEAELRQWVTDG